jgi:hypothetical protein
MKRVNAKPIDIKIPKNVSILERIPDYGQAIKEI